MEGSVDASDSAILPAIPKRVAIACRRCRRGRSKCINHDGKPPCVGCVVAGKAEECTFVKGNSVIDRRDRPRPTSRIQANSSSSNGSLQLPSALSAVTLDDPFDTAGRAHERPLPDDTPIPGSRLYPRRPDSPSNFLTREEHHALPMRHDGLVPHPNPNLPIHFPWPEDYESICICMFSSFLYKIAFVHRRSFIDKLENHPETVDQFLIYAILAVVAGHVPRLVRIYRTADMARAVYRELFAQMTASHEGPPSAEMAMGWFLVCLGDWAAQKPYQVWVDVGMGLRVVELLRLDRHETYSQIHEYSPVAQKIYAEECRRTVWALIGADDLLKCGDPDPHIKRYDPAIQLPCSEADFDRGSIPGMLTPPAVGASVFAVEISNVGLWCSAARRNAGLRGADGDLPPWDPTSSYAVIDKQSLELVMSLSEDLRFSAATLDAHRPHTTDIYIASGNVLRQTTLVLMRRPYLSVMLANLDPGCGLALPFDVAGQRAPVRYWADMADALFASAIGSITTAKVYMDSLEENGLVKTFNPMMVFPISLSALICTFLIRWPSLCPLQAPLAVEAITTVLGVLDDTRKHMRMPAIWYNMVASALRAATRPVKSNGQGALRNGLSGLGHADPNASAYSSSMDAERLPSSTLAGSTFTDIPSDLELLLMGQSVFPFPFDKPLVRPLPGVDG